MPYVDPDVRRARHREYMRERYRHDSDHRNRHKAHVAASDRRRKERGKETLDEIRASGCIECGATPDERVLHFHHRDPSTKQFEIANWADHGEQALQDELKKCDVLCVECHREKHKAPCGTRSAYKRGCRCEPCREAQSVYAREARIKRLAKDRIGG